MPRKRALLLGPLAALFGLMLTVAIPESAQASSSQVVASDSNFCVRTSADIQVAVPGLLSGDVATATTTAFEPDCVTAIAVPARAKAELQVGPTSTGPWSICTTTDWVTGTTGRNTTWGWATGPQAGLSYAGPLCGAAFYRTKAYAEINLTNLVITLPGVPHPGWWGGSTVTAAAFADR
jgi:hypothetical protein